MTWVAGAGAGYYWDGQRSIARSEFAREPGDTARLPIYFQVHPAGPAFVITWNDATTRTGES